MTPLSPDQMVGRKTSWYKKSTLAPGQESEPLTIIDINQVKARDEKYSVRQKGQPLGWTYQFTLKDGRTWQENTFSVYGPILAWAYSDGKTFQPITVKVFVKTGQIKPQESKYGVTLVTT